MYDIILCAVNEREDREYRLIDTLFAFDERKVAEHKSIVFANCIDWASSAFCDQHWCDAVTLDVVEYVEDDERIVTSYDITPGRKMQVYHGDECHEYDEIVIDW